MRLLPVEVAGVAPPSTVLLEVVLARGACLRFASGTNVEVSVRPTTC